MCEVWDAGINDLGKYLHEKSGRPITPIKRYRHHFIVHTECEEKDTIFVAGNSKDMYITVYVNPQDKTEDSITVGRADIRNPNSWPKVRALIDEAVEKAK